jgi:DNA-binding MarR family transcriptional regulator
MNDDGQEQQESVMNAFLAFASTQNDLTRTFALNTGLHSTDSVAIVAIIRAEEDGKPLTPVRLADQIKLTGGATSILLNRLEAAGHVSRTRGHADRRMVTLHSTPSIHAIADAFYAPLNQRFHAAMSAYSGADLRLAERIARDLQATLADYLSETTEVETASRDQ